MNKIRPITNEKVAIKINNRRIIRRKRAKNAQHFTEKSRRKSITANLYDPVDPRREKKYQLDKSI